MIRKDSAGAAALNEAYWLQTNSMQGSNMSSDKYVTTKTCRRLAIKVGILGAWPIVEITRWRVTIKFGMVFVATLLKA